MYRTIVRMQHASPTVTQTYPSNDKKKVHYDLEVLLMREIVACIHAAPFTQLKDVFTSTQLKDWVSI